MTDPAAAPPDEKDWTWAIAEPCPECGFDATAVDRADVGALVLAHVAAVREAVVRVGARERPSPLVWSALEYGCHVRDVCALFTRRLTLMLTDDDPSFDNWDQDETAVAQRYWTQDPRSVDDELDAAATTLAQAFDCVSGAEWDRPSRRSNGSVFTVDTFARYLLHDLAHHAWDVMPA